MSTAKAQRRKASVFFDTDVVVEAPSAAKSPTTNPVVMPPRTGGDFLKLGLQLASDDGMAPQRTVDHLQQAAELLLGTGASGKAIDSNEADVAATVYAIAVSEALKAGDSARAVVMAETALELCSSAPWACALVGWACIRHAQQALDPSMRHKLEASAAEHMTTATQLFNGSIPGRTPSSSSSGVSDLCVLRASYVFGMTKRVVSAVHLLEQELKSNKLEPNTYIMLAILQTTAGEYGKAQQALSALFALFPSHLVGKVLLAAVLLAVDRGHEVRSSSKPSEECQGASNLLTSALAHARQLLLYCTGSHQEGPLVAGHEEAGWSDPATLALHTLHYTALVARVSVDCDVEIASLALDTAFEAIQADAWSASPEILSELFNARAKLLLTRDDLPGAKKAAESAIAANPSSADGYALLGHIALKELGAADGEDAEMMTMMVEAADGGSEPRDHGVLTAAFAMLETAMRLDPLQFIAFADAATCRSLAGDHEGATTFLMQAAANELMQPVIPLRTLRFLLD